MADRAALEDALVRAHEAGDFEAAKIFADEIKAIPQKAEGSAWDLFKQGAKAGLSNIWHGMQTAGYESAVNPSAALTGEVNRPALEASQAKGAEFRRQFDRMREEQKPLMNTWPGWLGNMSANVAALAPTALIPGSSIPVAAGIGAATGFIQPVGANDSRGTNMAFGAGAGAAGQAVANGIGRAMQPVRSTLTPEQQALAETLKRNGVELNPAQATGSKPLAVTNAVLENFPLTAGKQQALRQAQQEQFNRAVGRIFGADAPALTDEVVGAARDAIGNKFTDLSSRNAVNAGDSFLASLAGIERDASRNRGAAIANVVTNQIDDILSKVDANGKISGEAYRSLDSQLGRLIRSTSNGDLRYELGTVQKALRDAMDASISEADSAAWKAARREYANLMTVAKNAQRSPTGDISAATLLTSAKNPGELRDLAKAGKAFLPSKVGDSGTAQRLMYQGLLTSGGGAIGAMYGDNPGERMGYGALAALAAASGPVAAQAFINSPAGRAYLTNRLMTSNPAIQGLLTDAGRTIPLGLLMNSGQ